MPSVLGNRSHQELCKPTLKSRMTFEALFVLSSKEGKEIAEQDNEEFAAEFYDVTGRIQDFISTAMLNRVINDESTE
jgi:hypothetical protein